MRVIVTGAASGIGRATCLRLARDGKAAGQPARIAAVDLGGSPALEVVVRELAALVDRYGVDRATLLRRYNVDYSPERYARLNRFYKDWQAELAAVEVVVEKQHQRQPAAFGIGPRR